MDNSSNLGLPYIQAAQAQKHVTHNEALRALDSIVQLSVIDKDLITPPQTPNEGDRYIIDAGATGAWASHDGEIAAYNDGTWNFYTVNEGWLAWVADESKLYAYDGTNWSEITTSGGFIGIIATDLQDGTITQLGVNTAADTANRLAVKSDTILFSHQDTGGTDGMQVKVNKKAASDTASYLFQNNFSGRAEIGLTGDDDFHFKISPDGTNWNEALVINSSDAHVSFGGVPGADKLEVIGDNISDANIGDLSIIKEDYFSLNFATVHSNTSAHSPSIVFRKTGGTKTSPTDVGDGEIFGVFSFRGWNNGQFNQTANVYATVNGTVSSTAMPTDLNFGTGDGLSATVRFVIEADGTVRPGADNTQSLGNSSNRWASIWAANGIIQTSDERDKYIVGGLQTFANDLVDNIEPILFRWNVGGYEIKPEPMEGQTPVNQKEIDNAPGGIAPEPLYKHPKVGTRVHAGWRAQDFQTLLEQQNIDFGGWGLDDKNDPNSRQWIRPDQIIPVLWESLRQTREHIKRLEQKVSDLTSRQGSGI